MTTECIAILCTCPSNTVAKTIANKLVSNKYAACVNILPKIQSIYTWNDKLESSEELLLIIKTSSKSFSLVESCIKENHTYDCPEIIATPINQGSPEYIKWITDNTGSNL